MRAHASALRFSTLVGALAFTTGCPPDVDVVVDGGAAFDAGSLPVREDAGVSDGGSGRDGGAPADAGAHDDAGAGHDAGGGTDGGSSDAGNDVDAGGDSDAGSGHVDAGGGDVDAGPGPADLGWPYPDDVPVPCSPLAVTSGGTAWTGWGNVQYPPTLTTSAGAASDPVYGQVYAAGQTEAAGQASGWQGELVVGPWHTRPDLQPACYVAIPAAFNVDAMNNDEYQATVVKDAPGLYGYYYRYRPAGGEWLYADLNNEVDEIEIESAGRLVVTEGNTPRPLKVVTLNLRCHADNWPARKPLVVEALARIAPDFIAMQEDCSPTGGESQSTEIRHALPAYTGVGYDHHRVITHTADVNGTPYDEGVAILSAHPVESSGSVALAYAVFPRRAAWVDATVRGKPVRVFTTHFDFGYENEAVRVEAAGDLLDAIPGNRLAIVGGDLNTTPDRDAYPVLESALVDLWTAANPSSSGLTFPASAPERRIDYLFVSDAGTEVLGARLLDDAAGAITLSDHLGVAASVMLP